MVQWWHLTKVCVLSWQKRSRNPLPRSTRKQRPPSQTNLSPSSCTLFDPSLFSSPLPSLPHILKLEKAFGERRYLRQGKAIRQAASLSSLRQRFAYAPFNAMVTKISKWSRIQESLRITLTIESLVAYAMPDIPAKFQKDPSITFWVILLTHKQTPAKTLPPWRR